MQRQDHTAFKKRFKTWGAKVIDFVTESQKAQNAEATSMDPFSGVIDRGLARVAPAGIFHLALSFGPLSIENAVKR